MYYVFFRDTQSNQAARTPERKVPVRTKQYPALEHMIIIDIVTFASKGPNGKLNNLIVKELTIGRLLEDDVFTYTFKPPPIELDSVEVAQNRYIEDMVGLKYDSGDAPYSMLNFIISSHIRAKDQIIVKGVQKKQELLKYHEHVHNIETLSPECPTFAELINVKQFKLTHKNHSLCSEEHVLGLRHWISNNV
jgi:hypothetical protein